MEERRRKEALKGYLNQGEEAPQEMRKEEALKILEEDEQEAAQEGTRLSVFSRELVSLCGEVRRINRSLKDMTNSDVLFEEMEEDDSDLVGVCEVCD